MTNARADEVPFLSSMEREPPQPGWRDTLVTVKAGDMFKGDGMLSELIRKIGVALGMVSDRGPDPDFAPDPEARVQRIAVSGGDYRPNPHPEWTKRRNAIIDGLLIAGIIALVSTSIYLLKTTVRLDTQYTERGQLYDERFNVINRDNIRQDTELGRHDERLNRLEQQRRDAQRNADDQ